MFQYEIARWVPNGLFSGCCRARTGRNLKRVDRLRVGSHEERRWLFEEPNQSRMSPSPREYTKIDKIIQKETDFDNKISGPDYESGFEEFASVARQRLLIQTGGRRCQRDRSHSHTHQLLSRHVERFRGGLVFKAHRLVYHSTLRSRVIKKKKQSRTAHLGLVAATLVAHNVSTPSFGVVQQFPMKRHV